MITLRRFESGDFQATLQLWNQCHSNMPLDERAWKRKVLLDPNFDPVGFVLAEDENGELCGFVYAVRRLVPLDVKGTLEPETAWISGFSVLPAALLEAGPKLLAAVDEFAMKVGARRIVVSGYTPNYFTQGVDLTENAADAELFQAFGYIPGGVSHSMRMQLDHFTYSEDALKKKAALGQRGVRFQTMELSLLWSLFEYLQTHVSPSWTHRVRKLLLDTDDLTRVHVALDGKSVVGFNIFGDPDGSMERFGPYGVQPAYRGLGIGRVLLEECLMDMKRRGLPTAWMQWASGDRAPILYEKIGFVQSGAYLPLERVL